MQTAEALQRSTLAEKLDARNKISLCIDELKAELDKLDQDILKQVDVVKLFDNEDKSYGEITQEIEGRKLKVKIAKTVKWDSGGLLEVAKTMPWEKASSLFKIEFSMGEKVYADLAVQAATNDAARAVIEKINDARTVKFSEPKIVSID